MEPESRWTLYTVNCQQRDVQGRHGSTTALVFVQRAAEWAANFGPKPLEEFGPRPPVEEDRGPSNESMGVCPEMDDTEEASWYANANAGSSGGKGHLAGDRVTTRLTSDGESRSRHRAGM